MNIEVNLCFRWIGSLFNRDLEDQRVTPGRQHDIHLGGHRSVDCHAREVQRRVDKKDYSHTLLDNVSNVSVLNLEDGDMVTILGANGAPWGEVAALEEDFMK
jgi:hypothetical protein